jgi:hypothetical protein
MSNDHFLLQSFIMKPSGRQSLRVPQKEASMYEIAESSKLRLPVHDGQMPQCQ